MKSIILVSILAVSLFVFAIACSAETPALSIKTISVDQAKIVIDSASAFILDVRTPNEFADGHISGAFLLPVQDMPDSLTKIDSLKQKQILVYCRSGHRSLRASDILIRNGFTNILNMEGGITAWKGKSFPVQSEPFKDRQ